MLRGIISEEAHQWQQKICADYHKIPVFCNSTALFSSCSSRKSSSLHNYCIRKRRKWPIQPYKAQWQQSFAIQLSKRSFKQSIRKSKTHLLSEFIKSFAAYEVDPTPHSYHFLFKTLIQKRPSNWDCQLREILDHIEKVQNFETPECIFIDLIKFLGDSDMLNDAVGLFFRIPKFRCEPSVEVFNVLVSVLCRNEKGLEIVPHILIKSQEMNIRIEESTFEILIRALCRIGNVNHAFGLLNHMVEQGFGIDQRICTLMLATMCRQRISKDDEIMLFLEDLKRVGFEPRKNDFCNVIRYLVKNGKGKDALELLKQMKMNGIMPDIMCYNLVLEGLINDGDFLTADKVFDELLVLGLVPDIYTYNMYISGLCMQKKIEDGVKMLRSMEELGCAPNLSTYSTVLRGLCSAGELDRAKEMVNEMQLKCMQVNPKTYEILINGLSSNGGIDETKRWIKPLFSANNFR